MTAKIFYNNELLMFKRKIRQELNNFNTQKCVVKCNCEKDVPAYKIIAKDGAVTELLLFCETCYYSVSEFERG